MKKIHKKIVNSDDVFEDLPLKYLSSSQKNYRGIKELKTFDICACEFCEKIFDNRYDYLIHNSKHIIIPLIKILPHYCGICKLYYLSEEEMNDHMSAKHNKYIKPENHNYNQLNTKVKVSAGIKFETDDMAINVNEYDKPVNSLISRIEKKTNTRNSICIESILNDFVIDCKVNIKKFEPPCQYKKIANDSNHTDANDSGFNKNDTKNEVIEERNDEELKSFKIQNNVSNRDKFVINNHSALKKASSEQTTNGEEERIKEFKPCKFYNNVIRTVEGSCYALENKPKQQTLNGKVNDLKKYIKDGLPLESSDQDEDPIVILTPVKKEITSNCRKHYNSIHFDDLMKPGIFNCKRCHKRFPNRHGVIVHEQVHLDLSEAIVRNNRAKHKNDLSNTTAFAKASAELNRYDTPVSFYAHHTHLDSNVHHKMDIGLNCTLCSKSFQCKDTLKKHKMLCTGEAVVDMCDICLYLRKRPRYIQYHGITRLSNLEVKRNCKWCGQLCEDISLVTLKGSRSRLEKKLADRIKFEHRANKVWAERSVKYGEGSTRREPSKRGAGRDSKVLTNMERLKLIQNRLKLMKK